MLLIYQTHSVSGATVVLFDLPLSPAALATDGNVVEFVAWGRAPVVIKRAMSLLVL